MKNLTNKKVLSVGYDLFMSVHTQQKK